MEEVKASSLFFSLDHFFCQNIILLENHRQVFLTDRVIRLRRSDNRFHRDLLKAQISQMQHVRRKIRVVVGKCTAHIIFVLMPALGKLLKLRHNKVVASRTLAERPHEIVDFLSSVNAQHHIAHLAVAELHDLVV